MYQVTDFFLSSWLLLLVDLYFLLISYLSIILLERLSPF